MKAILNHLKDYPAPDAVLFDLDGTLYRGNEPVPGADRLIAGLQARGLPCLFVTNNSTRTPKEVAEHLHIMGISAEVQSIVTSALATAYYVQLEHPGADTYVIGERGLREALANAGLHLLGDEEQDRNATIVVQGLDRELTYSRLKTAVKHLLNGAAFVQTNPDRLLPVDGGFLPGAGSIGASLQAATGIEPIIVGKPSRILMDYSLRLAGTAPSKTWVVGDNPYTDLAAGRTAGCPSILVLTGLCSMDNWQDHCSAAGVTPDAVFDGPEQLEEYLNGQLSDNQQKGRL
ncbi:HAD-IIA family hydrolase [Cohnella lupini]|uniref:Acid sugar phosphatase n=1 Tax=Cohnella lupini TaxID=1294267 RepID=A0A3D9IEX4_9BACL|nr:HAD-IIA family hydrolase [Cohnella lupini]RED60298.1 4-nitrophenyl phosphatase [Cohnella lupini]